MAEPCARRRWRSADRRNAKGQIRPMPTYEYKCDACGHTFEKFQSITSEPTRKCPQCGKSKAKRLLGTGAGLIFKGSGFYITDYRSESYKDKAKSESSAPAAPATGDAKPATATSAETKPAAKTEAAPAPKAPAPTASKSAAKPKRK
jgi:putative FmdB family regulatory protein